MKRTITCKDKNLITYIDEINETSDLVFTDDEKKNFLNKVVKIII